MAERLNNPQSAPVPVRRIHLPTLLAMLAGNSLALPCFPDPTASVWTSAVFAVALLPTLGFGIRQLTTKGTSCVRTIMFSLLLYGGVQSVVSGIIDAIGGTFTAWQTLSLLWSTIRLPLMALPFLLVARDLTYDHFRQLSGHLPGLLPGQKDRLATQLWLPWQLARTLPGFMYQQSRLRQLRGADRRSFHQFRQDLLSLSFSFSVELKRIAGSLEVRLGEAPAPQGDRD